VHPVTVEGRPVSWDDGSQIQNADHDTDEEAS
jgi:hypothetical protein